MTFIAVYQIRVTFSGRCFFQTINKVRFFERFWTEARVCTELQRSVKMGSQNNRKWQASNILTDWAIDRALCGVSLSLLPCFSLSPPLILSELVFLCIWTAAWSSTLPLSSNHVSSHCLRRHLSRFCRPFWRSFKRFGYFCLIFPCEPFHSMGIAFVLYSVV